MEKKLTISKVVRVTITNELEINHESLKKIAEKMMIAARTAPKGRGIDNCFIAMVEGDDIKKISDKMIEIGERTEQPFFIRDAENILHSPVMVILGSRISSMGLKSCGMCGFEECDSRPLNVPCVFNTGDLGIAVGSAASVAMDSRVDNRILYSAGQAVMELELVDDDVKVAYVIPITATSKNPFFDRIKK